MPHFFPAVATFARPAFREAQPPEEQGGGALIHGHGEGVRIPAGSRARWGQRRRVGTSQQAARTPTCTNTSPGIPLHRKTAVAQPLTDKIRVGRKQGKKGARTASDPGNFNFRMTFQVPVKVNLSSFIIQLWFDHAFDHQHTLHSAGQINDPQKFVCGLRTCSPCALWRSPPRFSSSSASARPRAHPPDPAPPAWRRRLLLPARCLLLRQTPACWMPAMRKIAKESQEGSTCGAANAERADRLVATMREVLWDVVPLQLASKPIVLDKTDSAQFQRSCSRDPAPGSRNLARGSTLRVVLGVRQYRHSPVETRRQES